MLTLEELARRLDPARTILLLGAGAAVPSGAPSGADLSSQITAALGSDPISENLAETASILEKRYGRQALVQAIQGQLRHLQPSGGLLALPQFDWPELYSTNFDLLLEGSYRRAGKPLVAVRSNFEYGKPDTDEGTVLYKLHGCITQDRSLGDKASMILTESDYTLFAEYRQSLVKKLELGLLTRTVLIIGQSLRDPHLKRTVIETAAVQRQHGAVGRIYLMLYERDEDRAGLMEDDHNIPVAFGDIDSLVFALGEPKIAAVVGDNQGEEARLPSRLIAGSIDVAHASSLPPDPVRLFHGAPATYGDIEDGLVFQRDVEPALLNIIRANSHVASAILGSAGVGKTSLARRVLHALASEGIECWEHRSEFPFLRVAWSQVDRRLSEEGKLGVLLVDDCPKFLNHLNRLVDQLKDRAQRGLHIVVTANNAEWRPRIKSPAFFTNAPRELSVLSPGEIDRLLSLTKSEPRIGALVDRAFGRKSRSEQADLLRRRCQADMFVCLKNIFATEDLDTILLREYAGLNADLQDLYRHVAFVEATGARVHRQLVLRLLQIPADTIKGQLDLLEGIVDEFDIDADEGLYGWSTRHPVIARTIARYKYADDTERSDFLRVIIAAANPSVRIERELLREICDRDFGVGSLLSLDNRERLIRQIISRAPSERVPRHRLIQLLLERRDFNSADQELQIARDEVGWDPPFARYAVRAVLQRAIDTVGILQEDRVAMLLEAERLAHKAIEAFVDDKFAYRSLFDVASEHARLTGDSYMLEAAYMKMRDAYDRLLDPDLLRAVEHAYTELRKYGL